MMTKLRASRDRRQLIIRLLRFALIPMIFMFIIVLYSNLAIEKKIFFACYFGLMGIISAFSFIKLSKRYLKQVKFNGDYCEFKIAKNDDHYETISTKIIDTKIELRKIIFPNTIIGRNYKLVVQAKNESNYKTIIQQYQVNSWTVEKFEEVLKLYREAKFTSASTVTLKAVMNE